jgi:hypothetical protein
MKTLVLRLWYPLIIAVLLPVLFPRTGQLSIPLHRPPVPTTRHNHHNASIKPHVSRSEIFRSSRTCLLTPSRSPNLAYSCDQPPQHLGCLDYLFFPILVSSLWIPSNLPIDRSLHERTTVPLILNFPLCCFLLFFPLIRVARRPNTAVSSHLAATHYRDHTPILK